MDVEHQWILDRCREVQTNPDGMIDLWAREHYKSTIITFGLTIQDILNNPEETHCILSHNRPQAKSFLRQIKQEFEINKLLQSWFPDVLWSEPKKQSPKWAEDEGIVVKRNSNPKESTVEAYGLVDGMPTGKHFGTLIYDDVVTEKSVTTADMIKKTTDMFRLSINLGSDGGRKRYIGTRYDSDDTYQTMLDDHVATPRIYPATDDGESSGNPVFMSSAYLDEKRKMGPYIFSCQMLQNPVPSDDAYFDMDRISRFDLNDRQTYPQHITKFLVSDYAITDKGGDWTVHGIIGVDEDLEWWILDWWRDRTRTDVWVDAAIDLVQLHGPATWYEEKGVIQKSVEPFLVQQLKARRAYVKRDGIPAHVNKPARARSTQGRVQMGMLHIPYGPSWADDLLLEMKRFPFTTVDDQVDVLSIFGLACDKLYGPMAQTPEPKPSFNTGTAILEALVNGQNGKHGRYD